MFIDEVKIKVIAWKWWDWIVSWRREKCIPNGWPRGWNGGNGWNAYIQTTSNLNTLSDFRHKKILKAWDWVKGWTELMQGWTWDELILFVPVWTIIKDAKSWEILADLNENNLKYLIARGWRWGYWNAHFTQLTRQASKFLLNFEMLEKKKILF